MKKALPIITLLAYIAAIIVCVVNIIIGAPASLATIIIFAVYMVGVIVLMSFTTHFMTKDIASKDKQEPVEEAPVVEAPVEEAPVEEAPVEEAPVVEDTADEIIVPVTDIAEDDDDDEDANGARFGKSRYTRTYASKLIQASDELKGYYSIVKNAFMSYKKVTCSVSREHERIRRGRTTVGVIKLRGKTILLYLALDPKQFDDTMYVGEDVSAVSKYADTPFLYRVNGPRKANRAVRLIAMAAEKLEMEPTEQPANEDYIALFPYESDEALIEKGLIIDTEAEPASV